MYAFFLLLTGIAQEPTLPLSVLGSLQSRAGQIAYQKKDWAAAQKLLKNAVLLNPYDGVSAYMLGTALIADPEKDPVNLREGTFYYARAAHLLSEPSLIHWVKRQYVSMFRTPLGLDQYWDFVRKTPYAPAKVEDYPAPPPEPFDNTMAFQLMRDELLTPNGPKFFEDALSMNQTPRFKGRIISHRPAMNPVELILSVDTPGDQGDVRVLMTKPLPGAAPPGVYIEFEGIIRSYQLNPFQLVMQCDLKEIRNWPVPIPVESSSRQILPQQQQ